MASAIRSSAFRFCLLLAIGCTGVLLTACTPREPLDLVIEARTASDYHHWLYRHAAKLGPAVEREFHDLEKERLLSLQLEEAGLAPEELRSRLRAAFHEKSVRTVLTDGYLLRRRRLLNDDKGDTYLLDVNHALIVHPQVEEDLAAHRARTMEKIAARQVERRQQITAIEQRLRELHPDGSIEAQLAPPAAPHVGPKREKGATL